MSTATKAVIVQSLCFLGAPFLGAGLIFAFGPLGLLILEVLFILWCWELFAYCHYRYARQEEFLQVLQTAAATNAPIETLLTVYLEDRPREHLYRSVLLFFVFPGYYWIHVTRSFDARLAKLAIMLDRGVPLSQALASVPGVVSRQTLLAITVGQFTGKLAHALNKLPSSQLPPQWLELGSRLLYPLFILAVMGHNLTFMMIFIIPKFERIFMEFRMKLPFATEALITVSRWFVRYGWILPILTLLAVVLFNVFMFSSRVKWYCPLLGRLYQMHARGQFLQTLGLMLETGKPLPEILDGVLYSGLLPSVIATRVDKLAADLYEGRALSESLAYHGLATAPMHALIAAAERANNLAWALEQIGDSSIRRCARLSYRLAMVIFPLAIIACSAVVGFVAVSMFTPLIAILNGLGQ